MLRTTAAFRSFWWLAAERQRVFFARVAGSPPPWTADPVLAGHRFTNAYRASDRVSQYLINRVLYGTTTGVDDRSVVLRTLLFKVFNRVDTWEFLESRVGILSAETFDADRYAVLLDERIAAGERVYSGAYIMPSPQLGATHKHRNHLRLLERLLRDGTIDRACEASSLRALYEVLLTVPSFGPFLAFQFAIDLNYSDVFSFSEMDHVVAGPGARDGISKCFSDTGGLSPEDMVRVMADRAATEFERAGIDFESLWGRPLQLIDCQNLFCEISKYSRVAHPELAGTAGRVRIKQRYRPTLLPVVVAYPPKWAGEYDASIPVAAEERPAA